MSVININHFRDSAPESGAYVLLDVRTEEEYREGHLPGSRNLPLNRIEDAEDMIEDKDALIFVYCVSGARSGQAAVELEELGYTNVKNLGGLVSYTGKLEV